MGKLDVHISHGSDHGWLVPVIVVGGLAVMAGGGLSGAASSVTSALIWAAVVAGITVLAMAVALVVLMRRSGFKMAHVGHLQWLPPSGPPVLASSTPRSSGRAIENIIGKLRRAGLAC
jgi:hypothetical protein